MAPQNGPNDSDLNGNVDFLFLRRLHDDDAFQFHFLGHVEAHVLFHREPIAVLARQPVRPDEHILLHGR